MMRAGSMFEKDYYYYCYYYHDCHKSLYEKYENIASTITKSVCLLNETL